MNLFISATFSLLHREVIRFFRQKNRIVGALATPLVFWFFIGSGLQNSVRNSTLFPASSSAGPVNYLQYFFPGTVVLILLFTAIFSTISIIEDRQLGFLQGVMVSPAPRSAIVCGKLLGGAVLATVQGLIFTLLAPLMGIRFGFFDALYMISILFLMSFGLTGLGFLFAWVLDSTQGFHAIMNLCLMPLWMLSGSMFPIDSAPRWLKLTMLLNPLTYSVAALHQGFFHSTTSSTLSSGLVCFLVTVFFSVLMFIADMIIVFKKSAA